LNTYPRATFGSRKLLRQIAEASRKNNTERYARLKEEWKTKRSFQFLAIGDSAAKGNRNTKLSCK
jgi:hypothetical protein